MLTEAMSLRYIQCRCATLVCIAKITRFVDFYRPVPSDANLNDSTASVLTVDRFPPKNHWWFRNGLGSLRTRIDIST